MGLKLEFHERADAPGLERLWREETDWGGDALQSLRRWFAEAPFGGPSAVEATDERTGRAVGQFRFMPSRVSVGGREVSAVRPFGTIVTKEAHEAAEARDAFESPVGAMYMRAVGEFQQRGVQLVYTVPDRRWVGLFRRWVNAFKFLRTIDYATFPLWSLPLPLPAPLALPAGFEAKPLGAWDARVDKLWESAQRLHGCQVVRDAATLRWKLGNAEHTVPAVERGGELAGLVASREKGDRQWLVCDLLAADDGESMRATLSAVCNVAHAASLSGARELRKVAVLTTPVMEPVARDLGFARDDYDFPLVVHLLDDSLSLDDVSPARWYVSAND